MRANQKVSVKVADDLKSIRFEVVGQGDMVLDMTKLHPDILARAACAGMAQVRIVDAAAVSRQDGEGNIIPEAERDAMKFERMKALVDHYMTGTDQWGIAREKGEGGATKTSITLRAVAALQGKEVDAMRERIEELARAKGMTYAKLLRTLGTTADVQAKVAELRGENPAAEELLNGL